MPLYRYLMILETPRLILRPFRENDLDAVAELMANQDFMRFSRGPYDRNQTGVFLERILGWAREGLPSLFAVEMKSARQLLGYCGFYHQNIDGTAEIEIGYRIHPEHWNRGIATEAARRVRDHAFADLQLPRVISLIHPENAASRRVVEKIGMTLEKDTIYRRFPTHVFSLSREEWLASNVA